MNCDNFIEISLLNKVNKLRNLCLFYLKNLFEINGFENFIVVEEDLNILFLNFLLVLEFKNI